MRGAPNYCNRKVPAMLSIALIGMMGSGKSTAARQLGGQLKLPVVDTDTLVEDDSGQSVAALINQRGEPAFRALETQALQCALQPPRKVIAGGGGIVLSADNRALLARLAVVFYLQAPAAVLFARVAGTLQSRPLLGDEQTAKTRIADLLNERDSLYRETAQYTIPQSAADTPEQVAAQIAALLAADCRT